MKTIKQQLAAALKTMKPHSVQDHLYIGGGFKMADSAERRKAELKEAQAHIRDKFEQARISLIIHHGKTRQQAEAEAFKQAMFRIQSWNGNY